MSTTRRHTPAEHRPRRGARRDEPQRTEVREVRAQDPELSPETNARLTSELRGAVGAERVRVPAERPHASWGELPPRRGAREYLAGNRLAVLGSLVILLTFAAVVALTTGDWWLLPVAAGLHALATMTVTLVVVRMTTIIEHPSPDAAAAMIGDGVGSPDERFSRMVEEFAPAPQRGAGQVLSPGFNERTVPAGENAPAAASEQSSAMSPTGRPSTPAGERGAPDLIIWATVIALLGLSIALPAAMGGGWMWLLTAVMVPLLTGWVVLQRLMVSRRDRLEIVARAPLVAVALCTAGAVAVFCLVVAFAFHH